MGRMDRIKIKEKNRTVWGSPIRASFELITQLALPPDISRLVYYRFPNVFCFSLPQKKDKPLL